jgi:hypothetical protein
MVLFFLTFSVRLIINNFSTFSHPVNLLGRRVYVNNGRVVHYYLYESASELVSHKEVKLVPHVFSTYCSAFAKSIKNLVKTTLRDRESGTDSFISFACSSRFLHL